MSAPTIPAIEVIDGADVLDDLRTALLDFVVLPSVAAVDAVTLWIAATHAQRAWNCATRLVIKAPEKRCGKSRLLDVVEATCHNPLITVNISPAALVRSIGDDPPTLLLDEADTVFGKKSADNHEDLRGIINAGHQRNRPYIRWDVAARSTELCPTFAMAALAGIGDMPDTIEDRAVIIAMRRRAPSETVLPYRTRRDAPRLHLIADRLAEWVTGIIADLADAAPTMPVEDRAADNWEPLIALADAAGGTWPKRARSSALTLVAAGEEHDADRSLGLRLLADIRAVAKGRVFVSSAELIGGLHALEESPWRDFNLTTRQLAARVRQYGVHAGHDTTKKMRGYKLADFADAWTRYLLPPESDEDEGAGEERPEPSERLHPPETLTKDTDTSEPPDGYKRPTLAEVSDDNPGTHWDSDARTAPDAHPQASGNPLCQMCGKANLYHRDSIARGICASCTKIIEARGSESA